MSKLDFTRDGTWYQLHGDVRRQPVLALVHGVGLNHALWNEWIDAFGDEYAVLSYDLLGHGQSANPEGKRSLADFFEQLEQLTNALAIERYHLVGFSLGALIALYTAANASKRLDSLVLLHSVYQRTEAQLAAIQSRYELTRDQGPMATVEVAIKRWFSPQWIQNNPKMVDSIRQVFGDHTDDGYLKAYRVFCDADAEIAALELQKISCRSLMITGSLEPGSTPAMSHALGTALNGEVIINEGHLHMALVEHADILINQVKSFLEKSR